MVAAPCLIPASALGRDGRPAPSNRLTMGMIGLGSMGMRHVKAFVTESDCQIVGVCDVDASRRQDALKEIQKACGGAGCASYDDFRELIARKDVDALCIAVPDHWHAIPALMGARAGKHIYGEKPLALTVAEGRAMVEAVRRSGCVWQTGSWQRSVIQFRVACQLALQQAVGKLHRVEVGIGLSPTIGPQPVMPVPDGFDYEMWLGPAPWAPYTEKRCHWNFRWIRDYSGGQVTDWGAHHIDIAQWGMGTELTGPLEVEGKGVFPTDSLWDVAITYHFECRYAGGLTLVVASENELKNGIRFIGDRGWIHVDRNTMDAEPKSLLRERYSGGMSRNLSDRQDHRRNFLNCVRNGATPVSNIEVAHRSATVCHLGNIAMQLGRRIRWNPDTEQAVGDPSANAMLSRAYRGPWTMEG